MNHVFRKLKAGTRGSALALKQVEEIAALFPSLQLEPVTIQTRGDLDKETSLTQLEGSDFFTREIEERLLAGEIDLAVHSAKDLEAKMPGELVIAALNRSISPYECLVSRGNIGLSDLPAGSVVGTSSRNRRGALGRRRPDLILKDIRGTIDERLVKLESGQYDALIMAHAALIRLGYERRIAEIISPEIIPPHPLQGRLAVQIRREREDLLKLFEVIDARKKN